ncbi:hypothetical protein QH494_14175 [Sphingomonas sp. AR_OL41]|uniref:hypothetical protein n=1 Tax=Sphingomonas sp. AR_OL41 TaxID=3042729 RepID=UPI0024809860|nr:hypothetical protein [Sphingomonas sp. AR_OL41]MDH7973333.1 hypothetical protein [Sphingomonas sp. AR_OL41]
MPRVIRAAGIAVLGLALLGAAGEMGTATVTMAKGYDKGAGFGVATVQQYYLLPDDANCRRQKRLAVFNMMTGMTTTKPVPAGAPINIYAAVERVNAFEHGVCQNNVIFTPLAGHAYSVLQRSAVWDSCRIEVIDTTTNAAPADLKQDNSVACIKTVKPNN